jgi:hypothetical protein
VRPSWRGEYGLPRCTKHPEAWILSVLLLIKELLAQISSGLARRLPLKIGR